MDTKDYGNNEKRQYEEISAILKQIDPENKVYSKTLQRLDNAIKEYDDIDNNYETEHLEDRRFRR